MAVQLLGFLPSIISGIKEYVSRKQKINKLKTEAALTLEQKKVEAQIRRIESSDQADMELDKASLTNRGWKDEYLLILTTMPMVFLMVSPFVDLFLGLPLTGAGEIPPGGEAQLQTAGVLARAVDVGFDSLSKAPEYYWWALAAVYIDSLGMRRMVRLALEMFAGRIVNSIK